MEGDYAWIVIALEFSMLERLCAQLMKEEATGIVGAGEKNLLSPSRSDYRWGYRPGG